MCVGLCVLYVNNMCCLCMCGVYMECGLYGYVLCEVWFVRCVWRVYSCVVCVWCVSVYVKFFPCVLRGECCVMVFLVYICVDGGV